MPRDSHTVRVKAIEGEPGRFSVESWSDPRHPHTVDLLEHGTVGECSCPRWSTHTWPLIRDGKTVLPSDRCRHINAAREYLLNLLINEHVRLKRKTRT